VTLLQTNDSEPVKMVEFGGRVPQELANRFIARFPQHGSMSWFVRTALEKLLEETDKQPPLDTMFERAISRTLESQP